MGEEFPIDKGASGKVLLAFNETQDPRWQEIRDRLWAVSFGERDPETASASVPVVDEFGELQGALTLSGPKGRFDVPAVINAALATLLDSARRATVALGGRGSKYDAGISSLAKTPVTAAGTENASGMAGSRLQAASSASEPLR